LDTFTLENGAVHLRDEPSGLDYPLDGLHADIRHIRFPQPPGEPIEASLSLNNSLDGATLHVQAPVMLQPLSAQAQVTLDNLALAPFTAAVRHFTPVAIQDGRLNLAGTIHVSASRIEARDLTLGLQQFAARDETVKPGVDLSLGSLMLTADRLALDDAPTQFTVQ